MRRLTGFLLFFGIFISTITAAAANDSYTLTWENGGKSVATITYTSTDQSGIYQLSGNYVNAETSSKKISRSVEGFSCANTEYPLTGFYNAEANVISFSVSWKNSTEDCKTVTGWTGYIDPNNTMVTNWWLAEAGGFYPCDSSDNDCVDKFRQR